MRKQEKIEKLKHQVVYPVITEKFCAGRKASLVLESLGKAGAGMVQFREKDRSDRELFERALEFRQITDKYKMLLIINDRIDLALSVGADGVHLGQDDLPLAEATRLAPDLLIGVSTHNPQEIKNSVSAGASYINIGPVFPTQTKEISVPALGLKNIREWSRDLLIPFSVMGGINRGNISETAEAGARLFAMVTEITRAEDPGLSFAVLEKTARQSVKEVPVG